MNEKKFWMTFAGITVAVAAGAGYMIYSEHGQIDIAQASVVKLRADIAASTDVVRTIPEVERDVIVLREINDRIREILPDIEDLNNLIRDFQDYSKEAGVRTSGFRPVQDRSRGKQSAGAFEKVAYQLTLKADIFQFLDFLDKIETHSRFMAVSSFKVTAASRKTLEEDGVASHRIQMEVETYKYVPRAGEADEVKISSYERKRDLLAGEITRRRSALNLQTYRYRGPRGRRDPLIDPRVPARVDDPNAWTVQRQMEEVEHMISRMTEAQSYWEASNVAVSVLDRMVQRSELEKILAMLADDLRRIEREDRINYKPAEKRLQLGVTDPLAELRLALDASKQIEGPSVAEMQTVGESMVKHVEAGEYDLALDAYKALSDSLDLVRDDPERVELAEWLRLLAADSETLRDFEQIEMVIGGFASIEGNDAAIIIDGTRRTIGDLVGKDLIVHAIRSNEVDFVFRGAVLTREY